MENTSKVQCHDCEEFYLQSTKACPNCGSTRKRVSISIKSTIGVKSELTSLRYKYPHFRGKNKVRWEWSRKKTVRGDDKITPVERFVLFDRLNDEYQEIITDLNTGQVIHNCKEPLSQHQGHGSAKKKLDCKLDNT
jgi:hypothetical protein